MAINILVPIGAALAAGFAYMAGKKKDKPGASVTATGSVELPTDDEDAPSIVAETAAGIAATGLPVISGGKVPVSPSKDSRLTDFPNLTTSAGWPSIVSQSGPTTGAVSVSADGAVNDAFDELLAKAIASGDVAQLRLLAMQALTLGMPDVAQSIQDEIARLTQVAPELIQPIKVQSPTAPVASPYGRATISMKAGSRGADVVEWQRITKVKQDGIFGPITDVATKVWQKAHGLVADGIVGPKTWAAAYAVQPTLATAPRPPVVVTTSGSRPTISMKLGSKGPVVVEWQGIAKVKQDGIFGPITDTATKAWQKAHGLVADGIVGPKTWAAAYATAPSLSVTVPEATSIPTGTVTSRSTIKEGSRGPDVVEWQRIIGVKQDGIFGPITKSTTIAWQKSHPPLVADGIVGPKTWTMAYSNPTPVSVALPVVPSTVTTPAPVPVPESDIRTAARELTDYLTSLGGLAGRGKEDKSRISGYMTRLGVVADGKYGRGTAKAVMMQGLVPVVPYYWPSTGTAAAKTEFTNVVKQYQAADPERRSLWDKLLADIPRS